METSKIDHVEPLTSRERDVADFVMIGATAKEIAIALGISHRTVESHIGSMKAKLGCARKSELMKFFLSEGFGNKERGFNLARFRAAIEAETGGIRGL